MLIMQQVPPAIISVMDRFKNPKLNELTISDTPHVVIRMANKRWYDIILARYLIREPPIRYPTALAKKTKEK